MNKTIGDKINGYGSILRLVTPILLALSLYILNMMNANLASVKNDMSDFKEKVGTYFTNHLTHHSEFEKGIEGRLARIETKLDERFKR